MKKEPIIVSSFNFPGGFISDSEKITDEFGLKVGRAIQGEWFRRDRGACRFYSQWKDYHILRRYARGEQPADKYKSQMAIDGDLSHLNLDWTPVPIIPKFVDIVVNGMSDRLFKIKTYAQDDTSQAARRAYQDSIESQMISKDILNVIKDKTGFNPFTIDPDKLPATDDELNLHMSIEYKPSIEIASEVSINTVLDMNNYHELKKRFDYDSVVLGVGMMKHEFLLGEGIVLSYVDPASIVHSYTEDPFYRDCFYWGEVKTVSITELVKIKPTITDTELETIAATGSNWNETYNLSQLYDSSLFDNETCTLLYFNYKTTKNIVYKKKVSSNGNIKMIEKDDSFNPPDEMTDEGNFEKVSRKIAVWYEGVMVLGTDIILKWNECENSPRPKNALEKVIPNYIACAPRMYKGSIDSLVRRMRPFADLIQIVHLKLQQVTARIVPDGIFLDSDGVNEVDLGTGAAYNPEDALRLYFQTGSVIGRSYTGDGEFNNARVPIKELISNSGASKTQMLIANYNHYLDMIRGVTGLNEARDGSNPDPNSLVGVQQLAALNSNTATRHILDAGLYATKAISEAVSYRISDVIEYSEFRDEFIGQIGKYNVAILSNMKDMPLCDFGIFVEVSPDKEQEAQLEADIRMALSKGDINLEDSIDIRELRNIKLANQMLKVKRVKKQETLEKMEMQKQAIQSQQIIKQQELASQTALQKISLEADSKIKIKQAEFTFDSKLLEVEAGLKSKLMQEEFAYNMKLGGMTEQSISSREKKKEEEKANRISIQNTQQSKLINQKKNNLPPMNFESNEDSLDGLGLQEFEPR